MRAVLLCSLLVACAGPSRENLAETPIATTPRSPSMPPPASVDDKDRYQVNQQFEDMHDAQEARHQAAPEAGSGSARPVKRGPAVQAPDRPKQGTAPSKQ